MYHLRRLGRDLHLAGAGAPSSPDLACKRSGTRDEVARLLALGLTRAEVARQLKLSKATICYHARRLGRDIDERCARRCDWSAVQDYYDAGHSVRQCIEIFGFSASSWADAVKRGAVVARPSATPIAELLVADTYRGRYNLKLRLLREGLKHHRCERCGLTDWCDEPLTLALHHINGVRNDNRLENLQLLCPNCHSQTGNYAGRNGRRTHGEASGDAEAGDETPPPPEMTADAILDRLRPRGLLLTDLAAGRGTHGVLSASSGRSRRPEARTGDRTPRCRRPTAAGRARGRRIGRRSRPPPRARRADRRP